MNFTIKKWNNNSTNLIVKISKKEVYSLNKNWLGCGFNRLSEFYENTILELKMKNTTKKRNTNHSGCLTLLLAVYNRINILSFKD